jgi:hypothetical protein
LTQSVSLILPVRDQQHGLRNRVLDLAEVLTDLATSFEILIVDYGSTELARELTAELAREFPQIRFAAPPEAQDFLQAMHYGILHTAGEIIFLHDPQRPFSPALLRGLWDLRNDDELVMAQSPGATMGPGVATRGATTRASSTHLGSLQMLRRSALCEWQQKPVRSGPTVERITRTDLDRDIDPACPQPNLVSRLRRLVFG